MTAIRAAAVSARAAGRRVATAVEIAFGAAKARAKRWRFGFG